VTNVAGEDQSRAVWPSSPSSGWNTGVDQLWGRPNGKALATKDGGNIEQHGPYQHGTGWPQVDGSSRLELFDANNPPGLNGPSSTGPNHPGIFVSEFGCVSWSSFESMAPTLAPNDWYLHAKPMYQRNYPCDNIIDVYWGFQNFNLSGELAFKRQMFQCILGQALQMKSTIEGKRSGNVWGTLIWQLNEIWPTGGWGSIEYGTPGKGQVIGGRWKPLHHFLQSSVFADVMATCGKNGQCYVKNDGIRPFSGSVETALVHFATGTVSPVSSLKTSLSPGGGTSQFFCAKDTASTTGAPLACSAWNDILKSAGCNSASDCIATVKVVNQDGSVASSNVLALTPPANMTLPKANVKFTVGTDGTVTITTDAVAAYVTLTTEADGRFSENVLLLVPGNKAVKFIPFGTLDINKLTTTLRVEHAQQYK